MAITLITGEYTDFEGNTFHNAMFFTTDDMTIVDPFTSECGRFDVDPVETYGLPMHKAHEMVDHNKSLGLL